MTYVLHKIVPKPLDQWNWIKIKLIFGNQYAQFDLEIICLCIWHTFFFISLNKFWIDMNLVDNSVVLG